MPAHILLVDGIPHDAPPLSFDDICDLVWSGAYNAGDMQVVRMPLGERITRAVLIALAHRSYELRETPDHLVSLFEAAREPDGRLLSFYRSATARWAIACDRAAYEARHGTLDGGPAFRAEDTASARAEMMGWV